MKRSFVFFLLFVMIHPLMAHYKAKFHVLVDTDGGPGDMRALCMMLAEPEIEVIAVTAVKGDLPTNQTIQQVRNLLQTFGHEGIPVGGFSVTGAVEMILHEVELEEMPVDLVALGPLDNFTAAVAKRPSLQEEVRALYWILDENEKNPPGAVVESPRMNLLNNSKIRLEGISFGQEQTVDLKTFREGITEAGSRYASAVEKLNDPISNEGNSTGILHIREEIVPLYMKFPMQFHMTETGTKERINKVSLKPEAPTFHMILEMLNGEAQDRSIVLLSFPTDSVWFESDVSALASDIIKRHGEKEWRIVCLTNEFHEHLGIYSILGAKMGLRAREYFHVGIDELTIQSYAGQTPPLSCMNDGLQVSTGATLGHGTIQVSDSPPFPGAIFRFKDRQVTLTVKEEFRTRIRKEVKFGVETYGLDSEAYWEYIRALALNYWLSYSRFEIFDIK